MIIKFGNKDNTPHLAINPRHVAFVHPEHDPKRTMVVMSDGAQLSVYGDYVTVVELLNLGGRT